MTQRFPNDLTENSTECIGKVKDESQIGSFWVTEQHSGKRVQPLLLQALTTSLQCSSNDLFYSPTQN